MKLNLFKGFSLFALLLLGGFTVNAQYCTPTYSSSQCINYNMYIQDFRTTGGVSNITNNNTGCGNTSTSYIYYNNTGHQTTPTATVGFAVRIGSSYPQGVRIYVDYNQDGDFTDAGENVWTSSGTISPGGTATGSFNIPASASIGTTRMRVRSSYATTSINPCGSANYGEAEDYNFSIFGNCNAPAAVNVTFVNSMAADFNWSAVTGTYGYDYAVTTSMNGPSTGTATNNTSATVTGLTPSTQYYVHVRNNCASYPSQWTTSTAFTTLPPCSNPAGFTVTRVDSNSADFTWGALSTAVEYQYFVNTDRATPTSSVGANVATTNFGSATALSEGTTYYVHIRSMCTGNDSSGWALDSMYIPIACRTSHVLFSDLTTDRAVAYWSAANTAYEYEYVLDKQNTTPQHGAKVKSLSTLMSYLDSKEQYYFHLKSYCNDHEIKTESQWNTFQFSTIGVGVENTGMDKRQIQLYPNPVKDRMVVIVSGIPNKDGMISILDMTGKVLKVESFAKNTISLDVSDLSVGMYMVQYTDGSHREQVMFNKL